MEYETDPLAAFYQPLAGGLLRDRREDWALLTGRIALAGGLFAALVGLESSLLSLFAALSSTFLRTGGGEQLGIAFLSLAASVMLFGGGCLWTGFLSMMVIPIVSGALMLLDQKPARDTTGKLAGAGVGYFATLPVGYFAIGAAGPGAWGASAVVFAHIALAIAMGQAAGALSAVEDLRRRRRGRLHTGPVRLTIWNLLAAMVPLSIVLTLLQLTGLMRAEFALATVAALISATAAWRPVSWLVNRWLDRRFARRRAARLAARST